MKFKFLKIFIVLLTMLLLYSNCFGSAVASQLETNVSLSSVYVPDKKYNETGIVTFGSYWQSNLESKEPIEWIVVDRQGNSVFLVSRYILDSKPYNDVRQDVTWENCTLRNWLNTTFLNNAFSSDEQNYIENTNVINDNHVLFNTIGGNNTYDKIFCLSYDEINKYFNILNKSGENKRAAATGTYYAQNNGENKLRVYYGDIWYNGNSRFWLRTPGLYQDRAAFVQESGFLTKDCTGTYVNSVSYGVRPALWVSNLFIN